MSAVTINDQEFTQLRRVLFQSAGIALSDVKRTMVQSRLSKRVMAVGHASFTSYLRQIASGDAGELRIMVDLLTTNETSFFREPKHFDLLRDIALDRPRRDAPFSVWSAACSSGEEPYTIAMVLMDALGAGVSWDVQATDISTRVLERARTGHYALERAEKIPPAYLKKYCLKGMGEQAGTFLIDARLRERVRLLHLNLINPYPANMGPFDVIFLRNVMIYFENDTKRRIIEAMIPKLRRGGHFLVGHAETLNGITDKLVTVRPSVYRKP
jgi:chemotaxis protein methyltransferase CheR